MSRILLRVCRFVLFVERSTTIEYTINIPLPSSRCKFHFASVDSIADYASRLGVMQHHLHLSELTRRIRSSRYRYQFVSIKKNSEIIRRFNDVVGGREEKNGLRSQFLRFQLRRNKIKYYPICSSRSLIRLTAGFASYVS